MTKEVQFRRGSSSDHLDGPGFTGALAEVTVDTTNDTLRVHDGTTKGGHELVGVAASQILTNKTLTNPTISGVSTISNGTVLIGTATSTGTASQPLQVTGGAYVSGNVGIGTTNPLSTLGVSGNIQINQGAAYTSSVTTPLYIASLAEGYDPASIGTSRYYQYFPSGTVIELNPTSGISSTAALIDATVNGSGGATNIYFGAVAGTANNGPANFVIGRRTGTSSWSESLRINTSGNVGIGTTNPTAKLEPVDTAAIPSVAPVVFIQRPNNVAPASIAPTNADLRIKSHSSNVKIYAEDQNANPLMILTGGGNLGIGTTNPSSKLTVSGEILSLRENTTQEGGQIAFARALDNASAYSIDCYNDSGQGTSPRLRFIDNVASAERFSLDKNGNVLVATGSSTGTASQALQVNSGAYISGSVGIGSTTPSQPLYVVGNILASGNILNASSARYLMQASSIQVLTSGTTYTPPSNLVAAVVIATGGGGGGGGADTSAGVGAGGGGGGGAGGTAIQVYTSAGIGTQATYSIGQAGTAGAATGTNGGAGGNTTFTPAGTGGALTATGGGLGPGTGALTGPAVTAGGAGGTPTGGAIQIDGGSGSRGFGASTVLGVGGVGGSSFWGGSGTHGAQAAAGAGVGAGAVGAFGAGGSGASILTNATGAAGAVGEQGVIFVLEFTA